MPEETLLAFADHGNITTEGKGKLVAGVDAANDELLAQFGALGVDIEALGRQLQAQGVASFEAAWKSLLARIGAAAASGHRQLTPRVSRATC